MSIPGKGPRVGDFPECLRDIKEALELKRIEGKIIEK